MPYPSEHAARQEDPKKYARLRRKDGEGGAGVDFIYGVTKDGKAEVQSIRFDASKFSPEEARAWLEKHGFKTALEKASGEESNKVHESILQTLERRIGGKFFPLDAFAQNVEAWSGVPVVYAQRHPDQRAFSADPEGELGKIGGRWVGMVRNPYIAKVGHPRLMGDLDLFEDEEIQQLWRDGKLSLSTGFMAQEVGGRIVGPVVPNHVLVFEERDNGEDVPKDPGSMILNKVSSEAPGEAAGVFREYSGAPGAADEPAAVREKEDDSVEQKELEAKLDDFGKRYANMEKDLATKEAELKQKQDAVAAAEGKVAELNKQLEAVQKAEEDKRWAEAKKRIPEGWLHGDAEAKTRERVVKDPMGFVAELGDFYIGQAQKGGEATGAQHVNKVGGAGPRNVDDELRKHVPVVEIVGGKEE